MFSFVFVNTSKIRLSKKKKENKKSSWKLGFLQTVWPQPDEWNKIAKSYEEQHFHYNNNTQNACYWMLREVKPFSLDDTEKTIGGFEKMAEEFQDIWNHYDRCTNRTSQAEYLNKWWYLFQSYRNKFSQQWAKTINATKFYTQLDTATKEAIDDCSRRHIKLLRETIDTKCGTHGKSIVINSIVINSNVGKSVSIPCLLVIIFVQCWCLWCCFVVCMCNRMQFELLN